MPETPRIDVEISGRQATPTDTQRAALSAALAKAPPLGMRLDAAGEARRPNEVWELVSPHAHMGRKATGTAVVHYAPGHRTLTRPFIFADGFNYGRSDLKGLWQHFNRVYQEGTPGFLDQLHALGIDVILLGFDVRHNHIQANAGVAVSCIRRAIRERVGQAPLIVGGVSMGGMVTRFALARMERDEDEHETGTYLSYDTPHLGAWTPLSLQQMAFQFEPILPEPPEGQAKQAELLRSAAARQLLWGSVPEAAYSGPVSEADLRLDLIRELDDLRGFPVRPIKLGVANGAGDGTPGKLPPGEPAFAWEMEGIAKAVAYVQPDGGTRRRVSEMSLLGPVLTGATSDVPAFDGAPGGTLLTYGAIADQLGAPIEDGSRFSGFVPTVSAIALDKDPVIWTEDLYRPAIEITTDDVWLDDFRCARTNTEHGSVQRELVEWIVEKLAK
ncbi:hypothetical protein [Embleya scabrispora]|uniref:hypothetical protein n=1 Tax=Embleya scabrispora TaxID=159449 RepID=UPI0003A85C89|nr:hypothetical protein [Embleya scabrispora]MYS86858.1 hypothetical protein [Streptomyces sp. SID5474]